MKRRMNKKNQKKNAAKSYKKDKYAIKILIVVQIKFTNVALNVNNVLDFVNWNTTIQALFIIVGMDK